MAEAFQGLTKEVVDAMTTNDSEKSVMAISPARKTGIRVFLKSGEDARECPKIPSPVAQIYPYNPKFMTVTDDAGETKSKKPFGQVKYSPSDFILQWKHKDSEGKIEWKSKEVKGVPGHQAYLEQEKLILSRHRDIIKEKTPKWAAINEAKGITVPTSSGKKAIEKFFPATKNLNREELEDKEEDGYKHVITKALYKPNTYFGYALLPHAGVADNAQAAWLHEVSGQDHTQAYPGMPPPSTAPKAKQTVIYKTIVQDEVEGLANYTDLLDPQGRPVLDRNGDVIKRYLTPDVDFSVQKGVMSYGIEPVYEDQQILVSALGSNPVRFFHTILLVPEFDEVMDMDGGGNKAEPPQFSSTKAKVFVPPGPSPDGGVDKAGASGFNAGAYAAAALPSNVVVPDLGGEEVKGDDESEAEKTRETSGDPYDSQALGKRCAEAVIEEGKRQRVEEEEVDGDQDGMLVDEPESGGGDGGDDDGW